MRKFTLILLVTVITFCQAAVSRAEVAKSWTDKIKFSGDFRYRYEFIGQETYVPYFSDSTRTSTGMKARTYDVNRNRIRVRLGLQAVVNSDLDVYFRIASSTGSTSDPGVSVAGDPVSTNQDLTGSFAPKPIWIDRAYVDYHPTRLTWLNARAGKQPLPFESTDLVWDPDLNLEGVSALLSHKIAKNELFFRAGGYWANLTAPSSTVSSSGTLALKHAVDQGVFEGQIGGKLTTDKFSGQLAVAYIDYGNVKNNSALYTVSSGNNTLIAGKYLYDYNLLDVNGQFKYKFDAIEPAFLFDFITNSGAKKDTTHESDAAGNTVLAYDKNLNTSWLAGLIVKFSKLPVDWDLAYNYRVASKDATIAAYADSDPAGGGNNFTGHKFMLGLSVLPATRLGLTYFRDVKDADNEVNSRRLDYDRIQADLEVKF